MALSRRKFLVFLSLALLPIGGLLAKTNFKGRKRRKIIVIGAGFSGLACARELSKSGHIVTILEARDRIGGRAHTVTTESLDLELGAAWIHGIEENPVYDLARRAGVKAIPTNYFAPAETFDSRGKLYPKKERARMNATFAKVRKALFSAQRRLSTNDRSLESAFAAALRELAVDDEQSLEQWHLLQTEIENEYAADASRLSLKAWESTEEFEGAQVILAGGYRSVADWLARGIEVKLNAEVKEITYRPGSVRIRLADGTEQLADKAVVTVPLGVLQACSIKFDPPLPPQKQAALGRLGMGVFNKVFLKFPAVFWSHQATWIEYMAGNRRGWPMFFNLYPAVGQPVLCAFVVGSFAEEIETLADHEIQARIMGQLRKMYGNGIPDPEFVRITRWKSDRFARGSYSFVPVGATQDDLAELGSSVGDSLFFAGEHTSRRFQATVHAAYITGIDAAKSIERAIGLESGI